MAPSLRVASASLVALSFAWIACSGEDEGASGSGAGVGGPGAAAGAGGQGSLQIGGRAGAGAAGNAGSGNNAGAAGSAGAGNTAGAAGNTGAPVSCLPVPLLPPPSTACNGNPPTDLVLTALAPMPVVQPLPNALQMPNRPDTIAVRARGAQVPLVVGQLAGGAVTWMTSPDSGAWDQISGAVFVGDDLWVTSSYSPHRLWQCTVGSNLVATCVEKGEFPHGYAEGTLFAIPPGTCGHPQGALLDIDTPADGEPSEQPHDAHLYDIASGAWSTVTRPTGERRRLTQVVRLADGRALFVGGEGGGDNNVATTELFDGQTIVAGPTLGAARSGHGMTLFPNGNLLVTGGYGSGQTYPSWEIVDVIANTSTPSSQAPADLLGRSFAAATGALGGCGYVSLSGRLPFGLPAIDYFPFAKPGFVRLTIPAVPSAVEYAATATLTDGSLVYFGGHTPSDGTGPTGEWHGEVHRLAAP